MWGKAEETVFRCRTTRSNRDLESSLRAAKQRAQGRAVEAGRNGCVFRWTGRPRPKEGGDSGSKSGAAQYKCGG